MHWSWLKIIEGIVDSQFQPLFQRFLADKRLALALVVLLNQLFCLPNNLSCWLRPHLHSNCCRKKNKLRWYPQQPQISFLQIFLKCAAKPSAGNPVEPHEPDLALCQRFPKPSPGPSLQPSPEPVEPDHQGFGTFTFSGTLMNLTWLCTKASPTFSGTFSGTLLNLTWLCTKASPTFSGTFSGTLLNLTWLCTKASQTFSGTFSETPRPSPEPSPEPYWTWPGSAPKPPRPSPEPSPEPYWTWPGSAPKPPRPSPEPSPKPPDLLRNLLRNPIEPDLALHQSLPVPFSEPCWTWPGPSPEPVEPDLALHFWHFPRVIKQVGMSQSATPATQNDRTTCLETFEKDMFSSFPHRHGDATQDTWMQKNQHFLRDFLQFWHFWHIIKQVGMSQSATPATQNNMTTCLETFEKDRFSSFPHRHGDATGNQRLETRHVDAEKPAFPTRLPPILTFLTHYQAGWNVTKCHACHAKRHDNFLGNLRKGEVLRLPP